MISAHLSIVRLQSSVKGSSCIEQTIYASLPYLKARFRDMLHDISFAAMFPRSVIKKERWKPRKNWQIENGKIACETYAHRIHGLACMNRPIKPRTKPRDENWYATLYKKKRMQGWCRHLFCPRNHGELFHEAITERFRPHLEVAESSAIL